MASWGKSVADRGAMERHEVSVDDLISELSAYDNEQNQQAVSQTDCGSPAYRRLWLMREQNATLRGQNATFDVANAGIDNEDFQVAVLDGNGTLNHLTSKYDHSQSVYGHWLHKSHQHDDFEWRSFVSYITIPQEFLHFHDIHWSYATGNITCRDESHRKKIIDYFKEQLDRHRPKLAKFFEEEFIFKQCERRGLPTSLVDLISTTPNSGKVGNIDRATGSKWCNIYEKVTSKDKLWPTIKKTFDNFSHSHDVRGRGKDYYALFAGQGMYEVLIDMLDAPPMVGNVPIQYAWALTYMEKGAPNVDGDPTNHLYIVNTQCIGYKEAVFNPMQIYIEPSMFGFRIGKRWSHLAYAEKLSNSALIRYCPS